MDQSLDYYLEEYFLKLLLNNKDLNINCNL